MIIIKKPEIQIEEASAIISSIFLIEGKENRLWYKLPASLKNYLVTENVDAFLVGLLFLGLKTGNNIKLESPVSARLYYTLNHYLIPALCLANPKFQKINIFAEELNEKDLNLEKIAGTGLSCGIDSFATYFDHINEKGAYKIKYFTFFNVGSHGDLGGEKARRVYSERLQNVLEFAKNEEKEVITVDSNISEILGLNFQQTNTLRSISCILNLQKLFKHYYYASSYRFEHFKLDPKDTSYYDILNLHLLSTESITFFSTAANFTRIEKTELISNFEGTYNYLDVCVDLNKDPGEKNCTECDKCLRTALTLELYGKLHLYNKVFDIEKFHINKDQFIGKLLASKEKNIFNKDLWNLLKKRRLIHLIHYIEYIVLKYNSTKNAFKKFIKRQLKRY